MEFLNDKKQSAVRAVACPVTSHREGCGFDSHSGLPVWSLHVVSVPVWVFLLPQSKDMHVWLISDSKLSVNSSGPVINCQLVRVVTRLRHQIAGTGSSIPADPDSKISCSGLMDGWMDGCYLLLAAFPSLAFGLHPNPI